MTAPMHPRFLRNHERRDLQGQTSVEKLLRDAHMVFAACGIGMSPARVARLVRRYWHDGIQSRGFAFVDYLLNAVQLTAQQRYAAMRHPDIARVIAYADPTGETAVSNVMRHAKGL